MCPHEEVSPVGGKHLPCSFEPRWQMLLFPIFFPYPLWSGSLAPPFTAASCVPPTCLPCKEAVSGQVPCLWYSRGKNAS